MKAWLFGGSIYVETNKNKRKKYEIKSFKTCYYCGSSTVVDNEEKLPKICPHCGRYMGEIMLHNSAY